MKITEAAAILQAFNGSDLTQTLARIESQVSGLTSEGCDSTISTVGATQDTLLAAGLIKSLAGQIHVVIHALGILLCLPKILEHDETVDYVSLGAGNTGRQFDLETNKRVAEFKFIAWRGGAESIRQNSIFKDFYWLAESSSDKKKFLYVLDTTYPLKFLNGGRALSSVLSRDSRLKEHFETQYADSFKTVREYFAIRKASVNIEDVSRFLPGLIETAPDDSVPKSDSHGKEVAFIAQRVDEPMAFYIYENWQAGPHKAVIHHGSCGHCNEGQGRGSGYDPSHAKWHGPYDSLALARATQERMNVSVRKECRCIASIDGIK